MAHPVSAYFGRDTYAILSHCTYCGKPYHEGGHWHTMQTRIEKVDAWCIACDKCYQENENKTRGDAE